ncbi:MAG: methionyl-tRNA formyltransferase [Clostridia bacterium]|nr:methionyl-tRNA formyltransferase [Clostridia bacterium]
MNILYMGTPEFAVLPLEALKNDGHNIVGLVCQPDKPKGRGHKLTPPPTKEFALANSIPVYQPQTLRDDDFYELLKSLSPDLIVVAAYGKILPENVLSYPKYGCINIHASLLPRHRGAAPIQSAIIEGDKETGVCTMFMEKGLDTGDILDCESVKIDDNDTAATLTEKLSKIGARLICKTAKDAQNGALCPKKQDDALSTYAKKIEKEDTLFDANTEISLLCRKIRALSPAPLMSATLLHGDDKTPIRIKIVSGVMCECEKDAENGTVIEAEKRLVVKVCGGALHITALIPEGKSCMSDGDFCRGRRAAAGDILE